MEINLRKIPMFAGLSDEAMEKVLASLSERKLDGGRVLFNQGDPGDELVIVKEGKIAIYAPVEGKPAMGEAIRIFNPGDLLGEMALVDQKPRSLSARAEEPATILTLSGQVFRQLLVSQPDMAVGVMSGLSERIRYTTDFVTEVRTWVRRIAEGNYQTGNIIQEDKYKDNTLAALAADFVQMAAKVQEREETLRQEVIQLRIEIDDAKRKRDADQIMGTDYYRSLKDKVKNLREQRDDK
jgi:CRP/FNR family transcriptional regulator